MKATLEVHFVSPTEATKVARRLGITPREDGSLLIEGAERVSGPHRTEQVVFTIWRVGALIISCGEYLDGGRPYGRLLHDDGPEGVKDGRSRRRGWQARQAALF